MKNIILPFLVVFFLLQSGACISQPTKKGKALVGVFEGRTPCQELAKQLNEITIPECIKIKWRLVLYKDSTVVNTGTYQLEGFVFRKDNILKGKWYLTKGTKADPETIVYQLDHPLRKPIFLQKGDDNVLFFLDREKKLMVGNRDFSYTLNRVVDVRY
ncbi:MAG: hypothetical protein ABI707_09610 [Ferruginibacter sp.]